MAEMISRAEPFGAGLLRVPADEIRWGYFLSIHVLRNRSNVTGSRIAAIFAPRRGRTNSFTGPSASLSIVASGGARRRGTAPDEVVLDQQGRGNDGADTAGARDFVHGDDQLHREEKQVACRRGRATKDTVRYKAARNRRLPLLFNNSRHTGGMVRTFAP